MQLFDGKMILITGGTGTIGNAVLERLIQYDIKEIRVFSRDEKKQDDMRSRLQNPKIQYYIGDVRDRNGVDMAMCGVDFVFHAAALKQVPSCEYFPMEAFKTNVLGTENVMNSAILHQVKKVVVLSTDKAVYPLSAMGISKAMMEKLMLAGSLNADKNGSLTIFACTRFGNIMGSRGSVIPRFIESIRENKTIRLTDPEMTRFMMTVEDAVELILYTFQHASNGDIFIRKAPVIKLGTLARSLLELFQSDVPLVVEGSHTGEKKSESLLSGEEMAKAEPIGPYFRIPRTMNNKNTSSKVSEFQSDLQEPLNLEETKKLLLSSNVVKENIV